MTDRELLELAAKAAGIKGSWGDVLSYGNSVEPHEVDCSDLFFIEDDENCSVWNPLTDDGDALRLAVKLGISITPYPIYNADERHSVVVKQRRKGDTMREINPTEVVEVYGDDPYAATRRAIVRAAAEIEQENEE